MTLEAGRFDSRLALGLVALALLPTWMRLPATWNQYQEHGYLVALIVAWLLWRDGGKILQIRGEALPEGVFVLGLISAVWAVSVAIGVGIAHTLAAILMPIVWLLTVHGAEIGRSLLPIGMTALLGTSVWALLGPVLRRMTALASGTVARLGGVDAEIAEYTITLDSGVLVVAAGCAGLGYLLAAMTLSAGYAYLFVTSARTQIRVVAVAAGAAIVGNWIRVAILIYVGDASSMQSPLIEDHMTLGWGVWAACMVVAYAWIRRVEGRARRGGESIQGVASEAESVRGGAGEPNIPPGRRRLAVVATCVALLGPLLYVAISLRERAPTTLDDPAVFRVEQTFRASLSATSARWEPEYPGIGARAAWEFTVDGIDIEASRFAFPTQEPGFELIQEENRLAALGEGTVTERIASIGAEGETRLVNEAIVRAEGEDRLVWYWYRVAGAETPFRIRAKLLEVVALVRGSAASELITMTALCDPGDCSGAGDALRRAVGAPRAGAN